VAGRRRLAADPDQAADVAARGRIADGCGAELAEILLRVGFEFFDAMPPAGCSAIACKGPQGAIVAQNWDAPPTVANELALFVHGGARGFEQAVIASVGGLAWVGCNRHGLALLNNDLMLRSRAPGLPSQIVRRIVLREARADDAVAALRTLPHMAGRSYLLGDATGAIAGVEVSAGRGVRVFQGPRPILHTNHALHPDIRDDEDEHALMKTYPSSRQRLDVLQRVASSASSVDHVVGALQNREGFPIRSASPHPTLRGPRHHFRSSWIADPALCTSALVHRQSTRIMRSCCRPSRPALASPSPRAPVGTPTVDGF
jgi:isopenicillin-N N-acyltransferase-like protein